MIGFILFLISSILKWALAPLSYGYGLMRSLYAKKFNEYNLNLAIGKDQYGNALCSYLFNDTLIEKNGYKFGNPDETISSVIGKNKVKNTLTKTGKMLDATLNFFDKNHSINSIDETENSETL